jgi:protein-disulfide isomerase
MKYRIGIAQIWLLCLVYIADPAIGRAQEPKDQQKLQEEIIQLKKEIKTLQEGQQQILDEVRELKKLLLGRPDAAAAAPQPAPVVPLNVHGESFKGESAAAVAIVEYSDFECPFCGKYSREIYPRIVESYVKTGKVKYYFRDLPLPSHPHALQAALAARCAGEQGKFWEMHDSLFANQAALEAKDLTDRARDLGLDQAKFSDCFGSGRYTVNIRRSRAGAEQMGINGTPAFAFGAVASNGDVVRVSQMLLGAESLEAFKSVLDELLALPKN